MQHYCDVFKRTTLQRTSIEVNVYMQCHQTRFGTYYIGNIIYHKFSHGDVSCRFNWVNVTLEFCFSKNNPQTCCLFLVPVHPNVVAFLCDFYNSETT